MRKLSTSCFSVHYDKGSVRWIKNSGVEILRMIYSAVRDHNWGTIEPEMTEEKIAVNEAGFRVETRMKYQQANIQFEAFYTISGNKNCLEFEMEGKAQSTFQTNRVGFCVLHPIAECAGKSCTVLHPDGTSEKAVFPLLISPDQPMKNIAGLEWEPAGNITARLWFSGEIFEMEDQRNWTDASYKTYCRPLNLPFPYELRKGGKIHQKVILSLDCKPENGTAEDLISIRIDKNRVYKIPEIGVGATSRREPLTKNEAAILQGFPFDHLRSEIHFFKPEWQNELIKSIDESNQLGIPLFVVVYFSDHFKDELAQLKKVVLRVSVKVKYVLIIGKNHVTDDDLFEQVLPEIRSIFPAAKIGAGVNAWFAELNRNRPQPEKAEFISFAVCPQVHASDEVSMVENLEAQKYVVESAKKLYPGKPVFVSPVTLKQRFNVVATSEEAETEAGDLPHQVDVRQNRIFAAQWLLGSLKFLAQSGTDLVTYYETAGWRGFIQGDFEPPLPEKFPAREGDIFPVFQMMNELKDFNGIIYCESNEPLKAEAIVLQKSHSENVKILIANFTGERQMIKVNSEEQMTTVQDIFTGKRYQAGNDPVGVEAGSMIKIVLPVAGKETRQA